MNGQRHDYYMSERHRNFHEKGMLCFRIFCLTAGLVLFLVMAATL